MRGVVSTWASSLMYWVCWAEGDVLSIFADIATALGEVGGTDCAGGDCDVCLVGCFGCDCCLEGAVYVVGCLGEDWYGEEEGGEKGSY